MNEIHTNVNNSDSIKIKAGTITNVIFHTETEGAVVIYGRGGHLGDFKVIVDSYVKHELKAKYDKNIAIKHIERKKEFLDYLIDMDFGFKINELHLFSHAFGDGLSLAYEDPALAKEREEWIAANLDNYYSNNLLEQLYDAIVAREVGILFNEDILFLLSDTQKQKLRDKFDATAMIKVWGCFGGYENYDYSANNLYWGALNYKNYPKISIAHGFAKLCNQSAFGSPASGTHMEVFEGGRWITTDEYKNMHGSYPSGTMRHRMRPDKGDYVEFKP